ncbi:hypothetical protein D3C79_741460 [compost metagenome]
MSQGAHAPPRRPAPGQPLAPGQSGRSPLLRGRGHSPRLRGGLEPVHSAVHEHPHLCVRRGSGHLSHRPDARQRTLCEASRAHPEPLGPVWPADHRGRPAGAVAGGRPRSLARDGPIPDGALDPASDRQRAGRHVCSLPHRGPLHRLPPHHAARRRLSTGPAAGGHQLADRSGRGHTGGPQHPGWHRRGRPDRFPAHPEPWPGAHPGAPGRAGGPAWLHCDLAEPGSSPLPGRGHVCHDADDDPPRRAHTTTAAGRAVARGQKRTSCLLP